MLATKRIRTHTDRYAADVESDIAAVKGVLRITEIRVRYTLKVRPEEADGARWAFENYLEKCPGAMSVIGCIRVVHHLELVSG